MDMTKLALVTIENVRKFVQPALDAVVARIEGVEQRMASLPTPQDGKDGADGKSASIDDIQPIIERLVTEKVAALPEPKDGKDIEPEAIRAMIDEAVAALPKATDGKDGRDGADGKSVTPDEVLPALREEFNKLVDAIPRPLDGKDGRDGKSIAIDDVLPMLESMQAKWALEFERFAQGVLERAIERAPKAKDGRDGADGKDGFSLDDLSMTFDGERSVTLKFERGELSKSLEIILPTIIDRGIYRPESTYAKSDGVTFGGSFWIAQKDQPGKPGEGNDGWRLAVKRGRDGRDVAREGGK